MGKRYQFGHSGYEMRIFDCKERKEYKMPEVADLLNEKEEEIKDLENALLLAVETLRHEHGTAEIKNICNKARENLKTQPQRDFELCEWFKEQAKAGEETNNEKLNYEELANRLIDDMIDVYGISLTIAHLYNYGLTKDDFEDIIELAIRIRKSYEKCNNEGTLTKEEQGYIQQFAYNYLKENYGD